MFVVVLYIYMFLWLCYSRYPDAVEFISGCIENHFAGFGLNVVFE